MAVHSNPPEAPFVSRSVTYHGDNKISERLSLDEPDFGFEGSFDLLGYKTRAAKWMPMTSQDAAHRLVEELGEAQAALGKCLRHGFGNCHPETFESNADWLTREIRDILGTYILLRRYQQENN